MAVLELGGREISISVPVPNDSDQQLLDEAAALAKVRALRRTIRRGRRSARYAHILQPPGAPLPQLTADVSAGPIPRSREGYGNFQKC